MQLHSLFKKVVNQCEEKLELFLPIEIEKELVTGEPEIENEESPEFSFEEDEGSF